MTKMLHGSASHADYAFEPLTAQDQLFLLSESDDCHMHVGAVLVFSAGPLARPGGGVHFERIRAHIAARLARIPRYRQRISFYPIPARPHWVDDERFDLGYHVRHLRLPAPGSDRQLKELCGQLLSLKLDRNRPLWEIIVIEGLRGGRFAMVGKTHHCLADGIGGVSLIAAILDLDPTPPSEAASMWSPKPPPPASSILRMELSRQVAQSMKWGRQLRSWAHTPREVASRLGEQALGLTQLLGAGLTPAAECPLNRPIGAQRRFEWFSVDLETVKAIKNRLGGTVNDVVLATVAGGLRSFLKRRRRPWNAADLRALVPVNMRGSTDGSTLGNHISAYLVPLPVSVREPARRYRLTVERMRLLKSSNQAAAGEIVAGAGVPLLAMLMRFADRLQVFNLVVTNVPGPPQPLYLAGARLHSVLPHAPLFVNQGLNIALFSYAGTLHCGLNADRDVLPDVGDLKKALHDSFVELAVAAGCQTRRTASTASDAVRFPPRPAERRMPESSPPLAAQAALSAKG